MRADATAAAQADSFADLMKSGVIDPTKVARTALQDAASIAGLLLTPECVWVEKKEEKPALAAPPGGGMGQDVLSRFRTIGRSAPGESSGRSAWQVIGPACAYGHRSGDHVRPWAAPLSLWLDTLKARCEMFRTTSLLLSSALTTLLASCSGAAPTSPTATADPSDGSWAVAAQAVTASSACTVSSTPEFTVTLSWSRLPVQRIVLWHSLLSRSYTQTLNHQTQKGTSTVQLDFEPVLAVFYDREGFELVRQSCS